MRTETSRIDRFHRVLVEEIHSGRPAYLQTSFTVAEIYQSLIPYRTHRDRLGVEINGDYEDALLRLLAGEGEYLVLESEPARRRIQRELQSSNPNTGIYREFAAVEVRLNPEKVPERPADSGDVAQERDATPPVSSGGNGMEGAADPFGERPARAARPVGRRKEGPVGEAPAPAPAAPAKASGNERTPGSCPDCDEQLPDRENLRFCPHCGVNVFVVPCAHCGEVLERSWRFCVACGTPAAD